MNTILRNPSCAAILGALILSPAAFAQTTGSVSISAKLADTGFGPEHWTVVWVTNATTGAFVRTIRKQGESYSSHWNDHCDAWYTAVAGNAARYTVALDGFSGPTASTYSAPNSPFTQTWNCKDASGNTVPDGTYKIWIQYAENDDSAPGPVTTGMVWTKGATASTVNPPNQGSDFTNMSIVWTPGATATDPEIAVQQPVGTDLMDGMAKKSFGTVKVGKSGTAKTFTIKNSGTADLTGLAITKNGTNKGDFVVTAPLKTTLAPGASTTFKVTFKPAAKGARSAAIHIKSNDKNENPFDIKLAGQAAK